MTSTWIHYQRLLLHIQNIRIRGKKWRYQGVYLHGAILSHSALIALSL